MAAAWWEPWARDVADEWAGDVAALSATLSPASAARDTRAFAAALTEGRERLNALRPLLRSDTDRANWAAHDARWRRLAAPLWADAQGQEPEVGNVVAITVGVAVVGVALALGIWGVAWAVAHLSDGVVATRSIELWGKDLEARRWAAEHDRRLEPSTLPGTVPDPTHADPLLQLERGGGSHDDDDSSGLLVGLGLLGLALAAGATWASTRR